MLEALAAFAKLMLYAGALSGAGAAFAWASLGDRLGPVGKFAPLIVASGAGLTLFASLRIHHKSVCDECFERRFSCRRHS